MWEPGRRLPAIAIGLAITAVVLAVVAVIVVARRGGDGDQVAAAAAVAPVGIRRVAALDVVELESNGVEPVSESGAVIGVRVVDPSVRNLLGLGPADVITAISGRAVRRQFDVYDVLVGTGMMNATALFVELLHDGEPVLVRWDLDGDLREARRARTRRPTSGGLRTSPPVRLARDPLLDTIKSVDDHHFSVPRATLEQIAADPSSYMQGARAYPTIKLGQPDGVRAFMVKATSVPYALGLRSGDSIRAVNGVVLTDPARLVEIYEQVKAAGVLRIEITRRGAAEVIEITQTP